MTRPLLAAALVAAATATHARNTFSSLSEALSNLTFLHSDTVVANTAYSYKGLQVFYLESENVTVPGGPWGPWTSPWPYLMQGLPPGGSNSTCVNQSAPVHGFDRPGGDLSGGAFPLPTDNMTACAAACCSNVACVAWVYSASAPGPFGTCTTGQYCCYLKNAVTNPVPSAGLWNGLVTQGPTPADDRSAPSLGIRSAVPLGGLGAGSFELRADGSMHEWTIINAYPQSTPKLPVQDNAVLSVRVAPSGAAAVTRTVRTAPPGWAPQDAGLTSITYSGAYPVSRLSLSDAALTPYNATVYAYSVFKPAHAAEAAHPAAVFSLRVTNPSAEPMEASFMFQLPAAAWSECARYGVPVISATTRASYHACLSACNSNSSCLSWDFNSGSGVCTLYSAMGDSVYVAGGFCGVPGSWSVSPGGEAATLRMWPPAAMNDPTAGDITLMGTYDAGASCSVSAGAAAAPGDVYAAFAANGSVSSQTASVAGHGASSVTCTVPAGATSTMSIVFAWYFPARMWSGESYGNFYANLWDSSVAVASELALPERLTSVIADIGAHHDVFFSSSMPDYLADMLVNEYSHMRQMLWTQGGYMRMIEAYDCPDLDSVHNDYQRHLMYLWYVPEFEVQKWTQYAVLNPAGYVNENPTFNPGGQGSGRIMGDTTTIWILEALEFYRHTGDTSLLLEYWPTIVTAFNWQRNNASSIGLPTHLICTYDILAMEVYNTTTFNAFLHLAAMKAMSQLAAVVGDSATATSAEAAFSLGQAAVTSLLWNSTLQYFRAYTGGDAIMADALYGQMVAWAHGLGWFVDPSMLSTHLSAELQYNGNAYGLTVVTGRHTPPPVPAHVRPALQHMVGVSSDMQDDAVWQGAAPDWSVLALALGLDGPTRGNVTAALEPTRRELDNWRSRLKDMWNIAGLTTTDNAADWGNDTNVLGVPLCTSHYGFALTDYYLVYALAGQNTNIADGTLSFNPVYACPYSLPAMMMGVEAVLSCSVSSGGQQTYTYRVVYGSVNLPAKGLSVNGTAYPNPMNLGEGDAVTWMQGKTAGAA